jgi:hypothetical protein
MTGNTPPRLDDLSESELAALVVNALRELADRDLEPEARAAIVLQGLRKLRHDDLIALRDKLDALFDNDNEELERYILSLPEPQQPTVRAERAKRKAEDEQAAAK